MSDALATRINGAPGEAVSVHDRGLHYGDGLFETVAVAEGRPLLWERHLARLSAGAARLHMPMPEAATLTDEAHQLCHGHARAVLKVLLTRGSGGRGYAPPHAVLPTRVLAVYPWPAAVHGRADAGVRVCVCRTRLGSNPALGGIKHLNRLEQVLARAEWSQEYAEGLMLNGEGDVIEGTMSNVFAVLDGGLVTPDVACCGVAGVMRALLIERARAILPVDVTRVPLADLVRATEVFLTNSIIGIWPVTQLVGAAPGGGARTYPVGPITRQLQQRIADALPTP